MAMTGPDFERLVREHERLVRALARSACRDEHAAEDVVQETFWRAWRGLGSLRDPSRIKTWLCALCRNAAIDLLRRRKTRETEELSVDVAAPDGRKDSELAERVGKIVDALREDYRQIMLLHYVERLSYDEIAEALGMTTGAVGEKLHRVRKMVAERLAL